MKMTVISLIILFQYSGKFSLYCDVNLPVRLQELKENKL